MAEAKTVTVYHPDLPIKRQIDADLKDRYIAAGWKASKPKGFEEPESE